MKVDVRLNSVPDRFHHLACDCSPASNLGLEPVDTSINTIEASTSK